MTKKQTDRANTRNLVAPAPVKDPVTGPAVLADAISAAFFEDPEIRTHPDLTGSFSPTGKTAGVILAGGEGERFGQPGGKQLFEICGRPILSWSITAFDAVSDVGCIVVVCHPERVEEYRARAVDPFDFVTPITVVAGGAIRQESAYAGTIAVPETYEYIAVHDGARPLVTPELIEHTINVLAGTAAAAGAVIGHPAIDTLKIIDGEYIAGTPNRELFWVAQTPQVFRADVLRRAYSTAITEGFVGTDDSSLVERLNEGILMVRGPRDNIKVTVPEDLVFVEAALQKRL